MVKETKRNTYGGFESELLLFDVDEVQRSSTEVVVVPCWIDPLHGRTESGCCLTMTKTLHGTTSVHVDLREMHNTRS